MLAGLSVGFLQKLPDIGFVVFYLSFGGNLAGA
jgi:hypothetical protein